MRKLGPHSVNRLIWFRKMHVCFTTTLQCMRTLGGSFWPQKVWCCSPRTKDRASHIAHLSTLEGRNIAKALGPTRRTCLLQNHGSLTCEHRIAVGPARDNSRFLLSHQWARLWMKRRTTSLRSKTSAAANCSLRAPPSLDYRGTLLTMRTPHSPRQPCRIPTSCTFTKTPRASAYS
jgi:hypothetical protein